jgi:hypothetical protein
MTTTTITITHYTCVGSVRGACGVRHRTLEAASRCCGQDHRDVQRGHGRSAYSDRTPRVCLSDGSQRRLTADEQDHGDAAR